MYGYYGQSSDLKKQTDQLNSETQQLRYLTDKLAYAVAKRKSNKEIDSLKQQIAMLTEIVAARTAQVKHDKSSSKSTTVRKGTIVTDTPTLEKVHTVTTVKHANGGKTVLTKAPPLMAFSKLARAKVTPSFHRRRGETLRSYAYRVRRFTKTSHGRKLWQQYWISHPSKRQYFSKLPFGRLWYREFRTKTPVFTTTPVVVSDPISTLPSSPFFPYSPPSVETKIKQEIDDVLADDQSVPTDFEMDLMPEGGEPTYMDWVEDNKLLVGAGAIALFLMMRGKSPRTNPRRRKNPRRNRRTRRNRR